MTVLYIIATLSLVILSNQNILENDTNRVLKTIDKIQLFLEKHPDNPLPDNFEHLPKNTVNSDTKKIKKGATYARSLDSQEITVTSPIFSEGQINGYLKVTENRTSTFFTDFAIIIFAILFFSLAFLEKTDYNSSIVEARGLSPAFIAQIRPPAGQAPRKGVWQYGIYLYQFVSPGCL